jgi:hypothetical protein
VSRRRAHRGQHGRRRHRLAHAVDPQAGCAEPRHRIERHESGGEQPHSIAGQRAPEERHEDDGGNVAEQRQRRTAGGTDRRTECRQRIRIERRVDEHRTIVDGRIVGVLAGIAEGIVEDGGLVLGGEEGRELRVPRIVRRRDVEPRPGVGDEAPCRRSRERALEVIRPRIDRQPLG